MKWLPDQPAGASGSQSASLAPQLEGKVRRARIVLAVNRFWPAVWLPLGVAGVFLLLSLAGVWRSLPADLHRGLLWGFAAALAVSFIPLIRLRWPGRAEGLRRLEEAAGLPHRPASSYDDQLSAATPSQATSRLWTVHRERTTRLFAQLKSGWPHPRVDRADPFALRAALILALAVAFIAHRDDAGDRIRSAFKVKPAALSGLARLDAWVTPPVYTGSPPVMLADGSRQDAEQPDAAKRVSVPAKSELTVRVNHAKASQFSLRLVPPDGAGKTLPPVLAKGKESTAEFKETLTAAGEIQVLENGEPVARWTFDLIEDKPPVIAMTEAPAEAQRGSLRFRYKVEDDYGVLAAQAVIERGSEADAEDSGDATTGDTPAKAPEVKRLGTAPVTPLTLPRANTKQGDGQTYRDLTAHYWAGLPVTVTLEARDQAGQSGRSEAASVILPERQFSKPMARALIEQRKKLVDRPDLKARVAEALDAMTIAPEVYIPDKSVYLGVRSAYWRLSNANDDAALESTADLLWSIAVNIEDGDLSDAERQLRSAQENLMRALQDNAPEQEIKRLMDELRTALNRFLDSVRQQAQNQEFDPRNRLGNERIVTSKDLERMLKQIEDLARTGSRDAARQMLGELRDLLENSQTAQRGGNKQNQEMMEALDGLSDVITKQQKLLDETYRAQQDEAFSGEDEGLLSEDDAPGQQGEDGQQGQPGQKGQKGKKYGGLQQRQDDVEKQLRQLMDKLRGMGANPPDQLDGAGQAMGKAGKALADENAERATEQQTLALDKLRQGAKSMAEQMMGRMNGRQPGQGMGNNDMRDPLGRPLPNQGFDQGNSVKVPEEADLQRARQILDELRRRLGERARPPSELDYIERLIERF